MTDADVFESRRNASDSAKIFYNISEFVSITTVNSLLKSSINSSRLNYQLHFYSNIPPINP